MSKKFIQATEVNGTKVLIRKSLIQSVNVDYMKNLRQSRHTLITVKNFEDRYGFWVNESPEEIFNKLNEE